MPPAARCDFNHDPDGLCGWSDPTRNWLAIGRQEEEDGGSGGGGGGGVWERRTGGTRLEGVRGDLSDGNDGHYLYVEYRDGQVGLHRGGAALRSPVFPPPPRYNAEKADAEMSKYYASCRVSKEREKLASIALHVRVTRSR